MQFSKWKFINLNPSAPTIRSHITTEAWPIYTFYRKLAERTGVQVIQTFRFKYQTIFHITLFIQHKECHWNNPWTETNPNNAYFRVYLPRYYAYVL